MKVLLTGATGTIGGAVLRYCLQHPSITTITTLTRRPFSSPNPKHSNIVISNFKSWEKDVMDKIADADAMVWALGSSHADEDVNYNFAVTFQEAMRRAIPSSALPSVQGRKSFRFILVSGALVEPDQGKPLYFMEGARKTKGRTETWCLDFALQNKDVWRTWIVRPGGVYAQGTAKSYLTCLFPPQLPSIEENQLGAFVADLVVCGEETEQEGRILNARMVSRGNEILETLRGS